MHLLLFALWLCVYHFVLPRVVVVIREEHVLARLPDVIHFMYPESIPTFIRSSFSPPLAQMNPTVSSRYFFFLSPYGSLFFSLSFSLCLCESFFLLPSATQYIHRPPPANPLLVYVSFIHGIHNGLLSEEEDEEEGKNRGAIGRVRRCGLCHPFCVSKGPRHSSNRYLSLSLAHFLCERERERESRKWCMDFRLWFISTVIRIPHYTDYYHEAI